MPKSTSRTTLMDRKNAEIKNLRKLLKAKNKKIDDLEHTIAAKNIEIDCKRRVILSRNNLIAEFTREFPALKEPIIFNQ